MLCRDAELEKAISGRLWQKDCQVRIMLSYSFKNKGGGKGGREEGKEGGRKRRKGREGKKTEGRNGKSSKTGVFLRGSDMSVALW